jgi:glycosyltransferase involved in cell wall biosynthesis
MHVVQFVHRFPPALGGAESYSARLSHFLATRGHTVDVWTTTAIDLPAFWQGGHRETDAGSDTPGVLVRRYRPVRFPARRYVLKAASLLPIRPLQCLAAPCNPVCPGMWRDAERYDGPLDAVHATAFPYSFPIFCALRLALRRDVPFFITPFLHWGDPDNRRDRTRRQYSAPHLAWLLRKADGVFVQTERERTLVEALGVHAGRIHLQGLGVEPEECTGGNRSFARYAWGFDREEVLVGHLANNSIEKGTVDLLSAAELAWEQGHRFRVVLAGPEMPNFRSFWSGYGPKANVSRLGILSDRQRRDFFATIDVHALPSRSDSFGLVLLEAWANGKPNLAYRAGGPGELIRHRADGLLAPCGDVEELAVGLGELVADAGLRVLLGERGRARIAGEFAWNDKLDLVERSLRGVSLRLEDHEVDVSVRAQDVKHRTLLRTRLLDRAAKLFR